MATVEEQLAQRQAQTQSTYDTRQAQDLATYEQRQAKAQATAAQRDAEAQATYTQRLNEGNTQIKDMMGKSLESQKAQFNNILQQGIAAQEEARASLGKTFQTGANDLAVQYERNRRNLNMQANARGLNTGTASQQQLALNQGYMSAYGKLRGEEGAQNAGIDRAIANLKIDTENKIAQAMAENDYKTAAMLYENYVNQSNWLDNKKILNQNYLDTQDANNMNFLDRSVLNNRSYLDTGTANNRNWADSENRYQDQKASEKAQILASYGNFSGYEALYGSDVANSMREMWIVQNPLDAYNTGAISASRYRSITGQDPPSAPSGGGGGGGGYGGGPYVDDSLANYIEATAAQNKGVLGGDSALAGKSTAQKAQMLDAYNQAMYNHYGGAGSVAAATKAGSGASNSKAAASAIAKLK